jgi:hypothetical protein
VARRFLAVAGLVEPRTAIFHPRVLGRVLRSMVLPPPATPATVGMAAAPVPTA